MFFVLDAIPFLTTGIPGFFSPHAVQVHITKHHQSYVDNANQLVSNTSYAKLPIEAIIQRANGPLYNNVAQHYNHQFFWKCLTSSKQTIPLSVTQFLSKSFGTVDSFKQQFISQASSVFGSGWCYLYASRNGSILISQYQNGDNPIKDYGYPILTVDTWEHAWYIDYENKKADYFAKYWDAVNWNYVEQRLKGMHLV